MHLFFRALFSIKWFLKSDWSAGSWKQVRFWESLILSKTFHCRTVVKYFFLGRSGFTIAFCRKWTSHFNKTRSERTNLSVLSFRYFTWYELKIYCNSLKILVKFITKTSIILIIFSWKFRFLLWPMIFAQRVHDFWHSKIFSK